MIGLWMAYAVAVGCVIAGMAWVTERAAIAAGRSTRWIWILAIGAGVGVPVLAFLRPAPPPPVLTSADVTVGIGPAVPIAAPTGPPWWDVSRLSVLDGPLSAAWLLATLAIAGTVLVSRRRLRREMRAWEPRAIDGTPVHVSPRLGPAVVGVRRPAIVVPAWVLDRPEHEQRAILRHEAEHIRTGDSRLIQAALSAAVLVPWHLPLWWMFRRLRDAVEIDCDRRVLRSGVSQHAYSRLLLDMSLTQIGEPFGLTPFSRKPSLLSRRIDTMLNRTRLTGPRAIAAVAALGLLTVAACETPVPPEVDPDRAASSEIDLSQTFLEAAADIGPERLSGPAPRYPEMLRQAGVEGKVSLEFVVLKDGTVDENSVNVLESTNRAFEGPSIDVIKRSRFKPGEVDGQPVRTLVQQSISYTIDRGSRATDEADTSLVQIVAAPFGDAAGEFRLREVSPERTPNGADAARVLFADGLRNPEVPVYIDGRAATRDDLAKLSSDDIASIEVVKGSEAIARFGEAAADGVIRIFTKGNTATVRFRP